MKESGPEGTPLDLKLTVVDASGCTPIRDAAIDIWHCDAGGVYSGFSGASGGGPGGGGGSQSATDNQTFLRGTQLTDADGWYRAWPAGRVKFIVNDPLQAHVDQLGKYTDGDMHDVLAYLQTLR